jgi:sigma-B regulation protein RsbU (phosphoserine phosphatase)
MKKILIVDDDILTVKLIDIYLKNENYQTISLDKGNSALELIKKELFHVVLLDVMLPDANGFDLCREITKINKDQPVMMITSIEDERSIEKAFQAGAVDYIRKPISKVEFLSRLRNVISASNAKLKIKSLYENLVHELDVARTVQMYFIPEPIRIEDKMIFSSYYRPSNKVGGDFFEAKRISSTKYLLYIGDISGHGVQAALQMTAVKFMLNMIVEQNPNLTPAEIINEFNHIFCDRLKIKESYLTMTLGIIDTEKMILEYYTAGHPSMMVIDPEEGKVSVCESKGGIPVGWVSDFEYKNKDCDIVEINDRSIFLLYTDGILESMDSDKKFLGLEGFKEMVSSIDDYSVVTIPNRIKMMISEKFSFNDDYTLLAWSVRDRNERFFKAECTLQSVSELTEKISSYLEVVNGEKKGLWPFLNQDVAELFKKKCDKCTDSYVIKLALNEWLMNIVRHGVEKGDESQITVVVNAKLLEFKVFDFGREWDFDSQKKTSADLDLIADNIFAESGRGIAMIIQLTEEFNFSRIGDMNMAVLKFKKNMNEGV